MASKILITPNAGSVLLDPTIAFQGAGVATDITLRVPSTGGILFEGTTGQLFSITDSMSGTIFSANDVSGIPSIEVLDTGLVKLAQYSGNVVLGSGTDDGVNKLQVSGSVIATNLSGTNTGDNAVNSLYSGLVSNVTTNLSTTTAATTVTINSSDGTNATIPAATTTLAGVLTGADKTKLDGIAAGAQTGTVTTVNNGNGMNFTNITTTGTVTLGTPSTLTATTTNAVTTSSHTHAITGFLTAESDTLATVTGRGNSTSLGIITAGYMSSESTRFLSPSGAAYNTSTSAPVGAFRIKLPVNSRTWSAMFMFTVNIYNYTSGSTESYRIGGHQNGTNWYNISAHHISDVKAPHTVRFGYVGADACIWIGETNTTWSYPQVFVTDFQNGYSTINNNWGGDWTITLQTVFDTVQQTRTPYTSWNSGNLTNLNQLTNGPEYVTSSGVTSVATSGGYGGLTLTGGTITSTGTISMGGTPTGTWPISISGNAATAATATSTELLYPKPEYSWNASTLPMSYGPGIQASQVHGGAGFPEAGSVLHVNTSYYSGSASLQIYTPYSQTYGGDGLQVRFANGDNNNQWTSWKTLLDSSNLGNYLTSTDGSVTINDNGDGTWNLAAAGGGGGGGNYTTITSTLYQNFTPSASDLSVFFDTSNDTDTLYNWLSLTDYTATNFVSFITGNQNDFGGAIYGWFHNSYGNIQNMSYMSPPRVFLANAVKDYNPDFFTSPPNEVTNFYLLSTNNNQFPLREYYHSAPGPLEITISGNSFQANNIDISFRDALYSAIYQAGNGVQLKLYGNRYVEVYTVNDVNTIYSNTYPTTLTCNNVTFISSEPATNVTPQGFLEII